MQFENFNRKTGNLCQIINRDDDNSCIMQSVLISCFSFTIINLICEYDGEIGCIRRAADKLNLDRPESLYDILHSNLDVTTISKLRSVLFMSQSISDPLQRPEVLDNEGTHFRSEKSQSSQSDTVVQALQTNAKNTVKAEEKVSSRSASLLASSSSNASLDERSAKRAGTTIVR